MPPAPEPMLDDEPQIIEASAVQAPGLFRKAASLTKAVVQHAATGFQNVTEEQHEERMKACRACEFFNGRACNICGCNAEAKSWWREQACPHPKGSRWPALPMAA